MVVKSTIRPLGVQKNKTDIAVMPFNYKERMLSQWDVEGSTSEYLVKAFMLEMFPDKKGRNALFSWETLTRNHALTYLTAFHTINTRVNGDAVAMGKPFKDVSDNDIKDRVKRSGMMTPKEIQRRYPPLRKSSRVRSLK
ncbi:hypothetical protein [Alteromonas sp. 14N.309.X.WAT.G.H12]|uniref:hypothetical protein n=1 Tax=Alteromonas sp. 14N.309.X.WAT.G.H12 TaxID=3120824 RepID=UPI002FD0F09E